MIDIRLYSAILRSLEQTHCVRMWFYMSDRLFIARLFFFFFIHRSGVLTALAWLVPHETAAVSAQVLCIPYNHAPCHYIQMLMNAIAHGACADTVKRVCTENQLWKKNPLPHRGLGTCVSIAPGFSVGRSTNWAIHAPRCSMYSRRSRKTEHDRGISLAQRVLIHISPRFEWQTAISQSARADETHLHFDSQFYPTVHNNYGRHWNRRVSIPLSAEHTALTAVLHWRIAGVKSAPVTTEHTAVTAVLHWRIAGVKSHRGHFFR